MNKNVIIGIVVLLVLIAGARMMQAPVEPVVVEEPVATTTAPAPVVKKPVAKPVAKPTSPKNPIAVPAPSAPAPTIPPATAAGTTIITYTNAGFSPASITVNPGTSVQFVNKSDKGMRIFTDDPNSRFFKELNQSKTVGRGGTFNFTFLYVGTWNYHNENSLNDHGRVIVE